MSKNETSNWDKIGTIVQVLVLIVMVVAISQTWNALKLTEEQTEKSTLPVIVFDVVSTVPNKAEPIIRNVGVGPAFNIKVHDYTKKAYKAEFVTITGLEQGGQIQPKYHLNGNFNLSSDSIMNGFFIFLSYRENASRSSSSYVPSDSNLVVTYDDIKGNKYQIEESFTFDFRKNEFQYLIEQLPKKIKDNK